MEVEALVQQVSESEVRAFLLEALKRDDALRHAFESRFGTVDAEKGARDLAWAIERAVDEYSDRGFLGWRQVSRFESAYGEILNSMVEPLVARGALDAAVYVSLQALRSVEEIEADDSDGFYVGCFYWVEWLWEEMLKAGDDAFEGRLLDTLVDFLADPPKGDLEREIFSYQTNWVEKFIDKHFAGSPDLAPRMAAVAQRRLASIERRRAEITRQIEDLAYERVALSQQRGTKASRARVAEIDRQVRSLGYGLNECKRADGAWRPRLMRALILLGAGADEIMDALGEGVREPAVATQVADMLVKNKEVERAIALLEASKAAELAGERHSFPRAVCRRLVDLYAKTDVTAMREELMGILNETPARYEDEVARLWLRLKESFAKDAWETERETWFARIGSDGVKARCLLAEERYDELMDFAKRHGLATVAAFQGKLERRYPLHMLSLEIAEGTSRYLSSAHAQQLWAAAREASDPEEWAEAAGVLARKIKDPALRMWALSEEGLYDQLMDEVEARGLDALAPYQDTLIKHCPERVLALHAADVERHAEFRGSNRRAYEQFADRLRGLSAFPGGREEARRIAADVRKRYPNRPALKAVLSDI